MIPYSDAFLVLEVRRGLKDDLQDSMSHL